MHKGQDRGFVLNQRCFQLLEGEPLAPRLLNGFHRGSIATRHIGEPQTEISLDSHQHGVTGFNGVSQGGFHGSTTGATHRKGQSVVGLPGVTQQLLNFTHQLHVQRIKVTDRCAGQGLKNRRMGIGGTGPQQQAIGRVDGVEGLAVRVFDWEQGIRHRQGLDGRSMVGAYAVESPLWSLFRPIATDKARRAQRCRTFVSARPRAM